MFNVAQYEFEPDNNEKSNPFNVRYGEISRGKGKSWVINETNGIE
jgi:hypothetical protein